MQCPKKTRTSGRREDRNVIVYSLALVFAALS
jgi:hypothetical protein